MALFKYMWQAEFADGHIIKQHPQDLYSKHDIKLPTNPSSFRDFLDYFETHPNGLRKFALSGEDKVVSVLFPENGKPEIHIDDINRWGSIKHSIFAKQKRELTNLRPIYYRNMEAELSPSGVKKRVVGFVIGYQGNDEHGKNVQKTVTVL